MKFNPIANELVSSDGEFIKSLMLCLSVLRQIELIITND